MSRRLTEPTQTALANAAWHVAFDLAQALSDDQAVDVAALRRSLEQEVHRGFLRVVEDTARQLSQTQG
jgi:hypothetical protein